MVKDQLESKLTEYYEEMVEIRRYLHQHPELSFEEVETPLYIAEYHKKLGHEVREKVGERGVVAKLHGGKPGPTIALRADFDALPMQDEKDVPYKSTVPGKMHACGHDGHTATLLVLAKVLNELKDELTGTIVFIHQHAEEVAPGGAQAMIADGCLDGVEAIYGTHLWATTPLGSIEYTEGALMAAADKFQIDIQGQGGHGAQPHYTKDAILIGSQIVQSIQHIVSRSIDPMEAGVVSVGAFEAVNAYNIIADTAKITGTARSFSEEVRQTMEDRLGQIVSNVAASYGAEATCTYTRGYSALINHAKEAQLIAELAKSIDDTKQVTLSKPQMGGEDFAYYLENVRGAFFFTGAMDPEADFAYPHHHPRFDFDERAMLHASKVLGNVVLKEVGVL
ncbi:amidohydrolase [Paenalkalicoccus suaedae]|uniref:Amidohydrolase n=1 Tax=Paenalkalicoccus suaedae TaxID=2592382 RepID=A0A859FBL6_9BACI|nr:amidohydrolase [Paenalkalicoccus suaedae]QKS70753.1 amidohydrolase [Paenalkalicoccus suaedae]